MRVFLFFSVIPLAITVFGYLELIPAKKISVNCTMSGSQCFVAQQVKLVHGDSLNFICEEADSIKSVEFFSVNFKSIPAGILTTFRRLEVLVLNSSGISVLESDSLRGGRFLNTLVLSSNKIETIPDIIFDGMINLKTLDLSYNNIREVSPLAFGEVNVIQEDSLDRNEIEESSLIFHKLESLNLQNNNLTMLPTFYLPKLVYLNLAWNAIESLNNTFLSGSTNLREVTLNGNKITHIGNVFNGCNELESLDLTDNDIKSIEDGSLNLPNLKELLLGGNNLNMLDSLNLPNLLHLDLSYNKFTTLNDSFLNLNCSDNIKEIILKGNNIVHIGKVFSGSYELKTLDLTDNNIETIENDSLNLPNLIELNLRGNNLNMLDSLDLSSLLHLDLSHNKFTIINETLLNGLPNIKEITLTGNNVTHIGNIKLQ